MCSINPLGKPFFWGVCVTHGMAWKDRRVQTLSDWNISLYGSNYFPLIGPLGSGSLTRGCSYCDAIGTVCVVISWIYRVRWAVSHRSRVCFWPACESSTTGGTAYMRYGWAQTVIISLSVRVAYVVSESQFLQTSGFIAVILQKVNAQVTGWDVTENRDYFGPGKVKYLHFLSWPDKNMPVATFL